MQEINVEKIMQEIREDIAKRGITEETVPFKEAYEELPFVKPSVFDKEQLQNETRNAMALWDTSLEPLVHASGLKGKIKKLLNKTGIVMMNPHMVSQNAFNTSVVNALLQLNQLAEENETLKSELESLKAEIERLKSS